MADEMISIDAAADSMIAEARRIATDQSEYGVHRIAEQEAWANAEHHGGTDSQLGTQWGTIASKISEKYQDGLRAAKTKKA